MLSISIVKITDERTTEAYGSSFSVSPLAFGVWFLVSVEPSSDFDVSSSAHIELSVSLSG